MPSWWDKTAHADVDAVRRRFRERGLTVSSAVPVIRAPFYPLRGGYDSMLARHRLVALVDTGVQVWTEWSGHPPITLLGEYPLAAVSVGRGRRRYLPMTVAGRRFWVHRRWVDEVRRWGFAGSGQPPG